MIRQTASLFISLITVSLLSTTMGWAAPDSPAVLLDTASHFTAPDGTDVLVAPGTYRIEQSAETQLRLVTDPPQPAIEIQATATTHEETVAAPLALAIAEEGQADEIHLVLLLPDGRGLDATGSLSGTRSRATRSQPINQFQMQQAMSQYQLLAKQRAFSSVLRVPPAVASAITPTKTVATSGPGKWITWNYLAMNHPVIVAKALAEVQAGQRPLASMSGLASPAELTEMLKTNWSAEVAQITPSRAAAMRQGGVTARGGLSAATTLAPTSANAPRAPMSPTTTLSPARATAQIQLPLPSRNLGSVWAGTRAMTVVSLTAPTDGYVRSRLNLNATNRHFRIVNAIAYTGAVARGKALEVSLTVPGGQYQDVVLDPDNPPAQISKAGFVIIPAKKGQRIDFTIVFEPVGLGMTPVGDNEATLELLGATWTVTASIRARFEGINFGIMAYAEQGHADTLTEQVVEMPIVITNALQQPVGGTIAAIQLPPGVTMESQGPQRFDIASQGSQRYPLRFRVTKAAQDGPAQPIIVSVSGAGVTRQVNLSLTIYHPTVFWCFGLCGDSLLGDIPGIDNNTNRDNDIRITEVNVWIRDDGNWGWDVAFGNFNAIDIGGTDVVFTVMFTQNGVVKDAIWPNIGRGSEMHGRARGHNWIRDNYLLAAETGVTFKFVGYEK